MAQATSKREQGSINRNKVDISSLRKFAAENLPPGSPLREIILTESDELDIATFLAILPILLRLSRLEDGT